MNVIFLHGPAASGKLTTARALAHSTGFAVFHNHLVVDALLALFPFGSEEFIRLRDLYWIAAFEAAAGAGRSFIFTFTPESTVPVDFLQRAHEIVRSRGGSTHYVALTVSLAEQEARVENTDRRRFDKLSSLETLRRLRSAAIAAGSPLPADLTIDTDHSSPEQTAARIVERFGLQPVDPHTAYPD